MYVTSDRLTLHQLARLLKAMADYAYAHTEISGVGQVMDAVALEEELVLTDEHRGQVYGAVGPVVPFGAVRGSVPGGGLEETVIATSLQLGPDTLYKLLISAWQDVAAAAKQEPAELVLMEAGGLLVPDPRDKDLDGLSIAELVFLVAHDKFDGRPLVAQPVLGCAVAAALLAELLLRALISVDLTTHEVRPTSEPSQAVPGIPAPVRTALGQIQDGGQPATLGRWLTGLSAPGQLAVGRKLTQDAVVVREERGRFHKKLCFVPTGEVVDSIFRVITRPLALGRMPTVPCALVIELARATGLTVARHSEWTQVRGIDLGGTLAGVPGREQLALLLALTKAEVTDLLSRP